ncbi:zinc-dependent alcohol dehydrogenase family protein [Pseudomonas petrae]|uniref:NAD(P)-dependent alcohol dehydrogenase n=1 Tax=Pseudomonas petrae TaxID=2912190 RepID=A0ABS9I4P4_9PSED|nr:NAD(P)-dependent alcohol dehydrogenase [Pseudomonas petrae]MCF7542768.1 NAD(P)-dependent alcohol dehydrogenase [Pseudomonas petrae]
MHSYRFDTPSLDGLRLHQEAVPKPQRGELLLRVHAVSLNYRDLALLDGRILKPSIAGGIPVSDAAAEVVELGEGVDDFQVGDRVVSLFHPRWFGGPKVAARAIGSYGYDQDGWLTEYKVVSREAVVALPDELSFEEGATLPCAAVTAWNSISGATPIRVGQSVLTLGSGGVSVFALQYAKAAGARVIATTSSSAKAERLKALGADEVINYRDVAEWGTAVRSLTADVGVDRVVEVGGPATIRQSLKAVAFHGEVVLVGFLGESGAALDYFDLMGAGASLRSTNVGDRAMLVDTLKATVGGQIKPVIDRVFPFAEARAAFEHLRSGQHFGKVVISLDR